MRKFIDFTIITLLASYVFGLYQSGKLNFYIHPRYTSFTYVMSLLTLTFCVVFFVRALERRLRQGREMQTHEHGGEKHATDQAGEQHTHAEAEAHEPHAGHSHEQHSREGAAPGRLGKLYAIIGISLLCVPIVLGFGLPVRPLSAATAEQRIIDLNSLRRREVSVADLFIKNTKTYSMGDWIAAFNSNPDFKKYVGKPVDVTGFVFDPNQSTEYFMAARFIITCCAVDARPIGLYIKDNWKGKLAENAWVRVEGKFALADVDGVETLAIIPEKISAIAAPNDPYVY